MFCWLLEISSRISKARYNKPKFIHYIERTDYIMSMFKKILNKLGFGKDDDDAAKTTSAPAASSSPAAPATSSPAAPAKAPASAGQVDVVGKLESLAAENSEKLDWKVSIVDLLKLVGIESSFDARKELATELGCPADLMDDSAKMNVWLHKTVIKKIAENGGNIPQELLD